MNLRLTLILVAASNFAIGVAVGAAILVAQREWLARRRMAQIEADLRRVSIERQAPLALPAIAGIESELAPLGVEGHLEQVVAGWADDFKT